MTEDRAVPATAIRPAVRQMGSHTTAAVGEGMATGMHLVAAEKGTRRTARVQQDRRVEILRVANVRTPYIHMSPLVMDGIGYRTRRLTPTTEIRWTTTGISVTIRSIPRRSTMPSPSWFMTLEHHMVVIQKGARIPSKSMQNASIS
ncbi:hypothetical protein A5773_09960 [Mycobacterium sp. 852014-52450_SCH5900713]|nr:hypothetical protein A5773_09960 [Mycobacterium sp. 852014-52450_SCH5900713]